MKFSDKAHDEWRVSSTVEGIQRARQPGYAFIADHILLEHIISTHEESFESNIENLKYAITGYAFIRLIPSSKYRLRLQVTKCD